MYIQATQLAIKLGRSGKKVLGIITSKVVMIQAVRKKVA
jgi:hypothetical protein